MSIASLKNRIARVRQSMPEAPAVDAGAAERNARRLATIAAEDEGPRRNIVVMMMVHSACGLEEPTDYQALVEAIGHESIERAFPAGIPIQTACADVRERARAWKVPAGFVGPLETMLRDAIAREKAAREMATEEAVQS
jgi:hypothetical protein